MLAPKRELHKLLYVPSLWFTSMSRLVTKQKSNFQPSELPDLLAADLSYFWPTLSASANTGHTHTHTHTHTVLSSYIYYCIHGWLDAVVGHTHCKKDHLPFSDDVGQNSPPTLCAIPMASPSMSLYRSGLCTSECSHRIQCTNGCSLCTCTQYMQSRCTNQIVYTDTVE